MHLWAKKVVKHYSGATRLSSPFFLNESRGRDPLWDFPLRVSRPVTAIENDRTVGSEKDDPNRTSLHRGQTTGLSGYDFSRADAHVERVFPEVAPHSVKWLSQLADGTSGCRNTGQNLSQCSRQGAAHP